MIYWGIIGAGNIAQRFAKSLQNEENAVLYAASGRNEGKLTSFQNEYHCEKIYLDHEQLLKDPNVNAIYIALPHDMHAEWAMKALKYHKNVLCEKPAVLNTDEMLKIAEVSKQENTLFMEAMKPRFTPAYSEVKKMIANGSIGQIKSLKVEYCFTLPTESYGKTYHTKLGVGGALNDIGCYCVNWVNDFLSGDIQLEKVYANVRNGIDYYVDAFLQCGNQKAEIICGFDRTVSPYVKIIGDKGTIVVEHPQRPDKIHLKIDGEQELVQEYPYVYDDFYQEIHSFDQCIISEKHESDLMPLEASIENAQTIDVIRNGFSVYTKEDLAIIEQQEKILTYESFNNEDAFVLGSEIVRLQKEYDRNIAVRIVKEPDDLVVFQYIMPEKNEKNIMYAEGKHQAILMYNHSSAWVNISMHLDDFILKENVLPSGGAFPIHLNDGTLVATVLVSGLHEGKDHELIVRAISNLTKKTYPDFIKSIG